MKGTVIPPAARRFQLALEMHEFGVQLFRQRMRREHPQASDEEILAMVRDWLQAPRRGTMKL